MHRKSENDEHGKTYHFASFCLDGPMLEILESNSWRGGRPCADTTPFKSYSQSLKAKTSIPSESFKMSTE